MREKHPGRLGDRDLEVQTQVLRIADHASARYDLIESDNEHRPSTTSMTLRSQSGHDLSISCVEIPLDGEQSAVG